MAKLARSRKKLSIFSALPPYLGGKRRLCGTIFREIDRLIPRQYWSGLTFLDAFLGGGSVSLYAKAQGFNVMSVDIAERSIVVGEALIANSRVRLTYEDILQLAASRKTPPGRIESEYVPKVFTRNLARFLDNSMELASKTKSRAKAALYKLLAIRVALLSHPMSQVRKGTIHRVESGEYENITESCVHHYVDAFRLTQPDKLWEIAQQINAGVFQGNGEVKKVDVMDFLPAFYADVAYFDPPYPGVMSYEKEYKVIDEILEGKSRPTSPFTAKNGVRLLDDLFLRSLAIPLWVLSLGNEVVEIDELTDKMEHYGRVTCPIEIKYQHLPAVATEAKKKRNREFLLVGWDSWSPLMQELMGDFQHDRE